MNYKNKANNISIDEAKKSYKDLIDEAINNNLWLKAKGLNLWLSPFEIQIGWELGKYLFPVNYWELADPNNYLRPFAIKYEKAKNSYEYAHKRYAAYVKMLQKINNI